ncbi:hypothetical protein NMG60_11009312 [Bertholletia excelsa]
MELEDHESKFFCKFCNKKYPCGKSLGGHMRSHVTTNSAGSEDKLESNDQRLEISGNSGFAYGLREKPKRTWRVSDPTFPWQQKEQICKQCGKVFQSLKALCGHMACHTDRERALKEDDESWTSENSDMEAEDVLPRLPRRTASMKNKRIAVKSSFLASGSSSVSEIDHEQEEVAMCLMMLSRDSVNCVDVYSSADSSDDNSVVLETKSSSLDTRVRRKKGFLNRVDHNSYGKVKSKYGASDVEAVELENSDSGYFMNGPKKVDSDVSVDGFFTNDNSKKHEGEGGYGFKEKVYYGESGIASGKRVSNTSTYNPDSRKNISLQGKTSPKRSKYEYNNKKKQVPNQDLSSDGKRRLKSKKSKGHECPICLRLFKSGQALGGHKRSHFLGASAERTSHQSSEIVQELSKAPNLFDLNLLAPEEE